MRPKPEAIELEFPVIDWPISDKKMRQAWGQLERAAEDQDRRIVRGSKKIFRRKDMIVLKCGVVQNGNT